MALSRNALYALYDRLKIPGVVDAHCHFMPEQVFAKVWKWFDDEAPVPWPITYRGDEDARRKWLTELRVVRYTALNYAHKPEMAQWLNRWSRELLDRDPKVIGSATMFPEPTAQEYIRDALGDPRIKLIKLHLLVGRFHPDDPLLHPCYEQMQDAGRTLVIHCGSAPLAGEHTTPDALRKVMDHFPDLKIVVAHMGGYEYEEYLTLAEERETVYLDTAMVFVDFGATGGFPDKLYPRLRRLHDKVLFGSDFPSIPYAFEHAIEGLTRLNMGDGWMKAVLHDNAMRLFGGVL